MLYYLVIRPQLITSWRITLTSSTVSIRQPQILFFWPHIYKAYLVQLVPADFIG